MQKVLCGALIASLLAGCGGQIQTAPPTAFHFNASESALRAVHAPPSRTINYTDASRRTDPALAKVAIAHGNQPAGCVTAYAARKAPQSNRSPDAGCTGGSGGGSFTTVNQDGYDFQLDSTATYTGDAYDSAGTQHLTHVTENPQAAQPLNISFPASNVTVTEPAVAVESVPTDQWIQLYGCQVYISSNGVDAWISGSDGNAYSLHDNRNQTMTVTNSSTGASFTVSFADYPVQYAMGGRNRLHAACTVGWAAAGSITAAAFLGGARAAINGGIVLTFPGGGFVEAGIFALGAAFSGWAAYHAFCGLKVAQ